MKRMVTCLAIAMGELILTEMSSIQWALMIQRELKSFLWKVLRIKKESNLAMMTAELILTEMNSI